jgi:hypothetical protein
MAVVRWLQAHERGAGRVSGDVPVLKMTSSLWYKHVVGVRDGAVVEALR